MKKSICLLLALLFCFLLAGCGDTGSLPEGMDAATAEAMAKELVDAMNQKDFDKMVELYTGVESYDLTPPTAAEWEESAKQIEEKVQLGTFKEYTTTRYMSVEDEMFGEYGVVILGAKYEKKSIAWRVSFDKDMNYIGLRL